MTKSNTGGWAFPTGYLLEGGNSGGMTLRDYFAAQALQALIATSSWIAEDNRLKLASDAYGYADAMLAERSKEAK